MSNPSLPALTVDGRRDDDDDDSDSDKDRPRRAPSPLANRLPSRSPQPYRRKPPSSSLPPPPPPRPQRLNSNNNNNGSRYPPSPALTPSPVGSRAPSPFCGGGGGRSESGTEADDELARKLPGVGRRKRGSSEEEMFHDEDGDGRERRKNRNNGGGGEAGKEAGVDRKVKGIVFVRRGIEIGLMGVLVGIVVMGGEGRVWKEVVSWRKEISIWISMLALIILSYPLRILLRNVPLQLPPSLDPSPLLYPTLLPVLVALSLTPQNPNPYLLTNLILSLASLPPIFIPARYLHWLLSLAPLLASAISQPGLIPDGDILSALPLLHTTVAAVTSDLLSPSLTKTEIRLLSASLIDLLLHASSPQAVILKALLWGGGLGVLLFCEDIIKWNVNLARIPSTRLRRAGTAIISMGRFKKLLRFKQKKGQSPDSEEDSPPPPPPLQPPRPSSLASSRKPTRQQRKKKPNGATFYTSLTTSEVNFRKWAYASAVYIIILFIIMFGLRPYIATHALSGTDPFLWAPSYLLCGLPIYQHLIDTLSPGTGYCVTDGSTAAANARLIIIAYWAMTVLAGITLVTSLASKLEVDSRRKVFHGMVLAMFLFPGMSDPLFTHLCLSVALAVFLLLDLIRAAQLPPFSAIIARFLQPFVDGRDLKGPVVVSHVFLLLGCAFGWWLTIAGITDDSSSTTATTTTAWDTTNRKPELSLVAGVLCVGLGDAAASLIGRRYGTIKWGWRGGKSLQGSMAFLIAVVGGFGAAKYWIERTAAAAAEGSSRNGGGGAKSWMGILAVGVWGSLVEAVVTGVNDNVVVPVGVWLVVRGLGL